MVPMRRMHTLNLPVGGHNVALGGGSSSSSSSSSSVSSEPLDQVQAIAYELQLPLMLWAHYGAPRRVTVETSGRKRGSSLGLR